mgnify:FL=1
MKRCEFCRDGLHEVDGAGGKFVTCTLIPPQAVVTVQDSAAVIIWPRPPMTRDAFCGQFKLSVMKFLFRRGP